MNIMGIVLVVIGAVILILSYVLPMGKKEEQAEQVQKIDEKQIRELIEKEIKDARSHINDVVDETITYSMEKTERAMERLTNEKIMAVNEYSELVLQSINKNHQEVMFLYDMLNDKHENLVNTVSEASKKAKEIKQTVQDAEITVKETADSLLEENQNKEAEIETDIEKLQDSSEKKEENEVPSEGNEFIPISPKRVEVIQGVIQEMDEENSPIAESNAAEQEKAEEEEKMPNNNEKILRLHKLGKSKTAIAKELGLGVGEVKLVIDLFEQA